MHRWFILMGLAAELLAGVMFWMSSSAWTAGMTDWLPQGWILIGLVLHTGASYYLSRVFWLLLPRRYKLPARRSLGFLFVIQWILPVLGALGVLWSITIALKRPRARSSRNIRFVVSPELPFSPPVVLPVLPYSEGALRQIVHFAERSPLKRLKAVMATRQMAPREAMPVWSPATRDPVDDVRLLAYAMRDDHEKRLTDRILSLTETLPGFPRGARAARHKTIAALCWELVYHRLVQGAVREHWLKTARRHMQSALLSQADNPDRRGGANASTAASSPVPPGREGSISSSGDGDAWMLYGRILLEADDSAAAHQAFEHARAGGVDEQKLLPWLAEIAFRDRRFSETKSHLGALRAQGEQGRNLARVRAWWSR